MASLRLKSGGIVYSDKSEKTEIVIKMPIKGDRFCACYRYNSCWLKVAFFYKQEDMPAETQFVLAKKDKKYVIYIALCDGTARSSIFGKDGKTYCRVETGDENCPLGKFRYLYELECEDPYKGIDIAYYDLSELLGTFALKKDKKQPEFTEYFGYCTYNAFGSAITAEKIEYTLKRFEENGTPIGFVILDEGWMETEDERLSSFSADKTKFPKGLSGVVSRCKKKYGIKKFLCWHTFDGYWRGVAKKKFPEFDIEDELFAVSERFSSKENEEFYPTRLIGRTRSVFRKDIDKFYREFYRALKKQGVDGAKIDAMTWIEAFAQGKGGRVKVMTELLRSIETNSDNFFKGNHINCSGCSNDLFMNLKNGTIVRTSDDYLPDNKESYYSHTEINAFVGFFVSPVATADWDMFQSFGEYGLFNATARAVSGGPIYCTDLPDKANFNILSSLCLKDGRVKRCRDNAVPTVSCLFGTPDGEPFRVFGKTDFGYVLAAFGKAGETVAANISLNEINGISDGDYAVYSSLHGFIGTFTNNGSIKCVLEENQAELFTVSEIKDGFAVIGMTEKLNPSAFISKLEDTNGLLTVYAEEVGKIGLYSSISGFCEYVGREISVDKRNKEKSLCV